MAKSNNHEAFQKNEHICHGKRLGRLLKGWGKKKGGERKRKDLQKGLVCTTDRT